MRLVDCIDAVDARAVTWQRRRLQGIDLTGWIARRQLLKLVQIVKSSVTGEGGRVVLVFLACFLLLIVVEEARRAGPGIH